MEIEPKAETGLGLQINLELADSLFTFSVLLSFRTWSRQEMFQVPSRCGLTLLSRIGRVERGIRRGKNPKEVLRMMKN